MKKWSGLILLMWLAVVCFLSLQQAVLAQEINEAGSSRDKDVFGSGIAAGYVARQENLRSFFGGVSSYLGKAIIVSKLAAGKQISGDFDFSTGDVVSKVSRQMGLIAYYDGNVIYIYDASETKNSVIKLQNVSPKALRLFLKKSGLADPRYPLRGDDVDTFYLSGPPIYVDLVTQAAQFIDSQDVHIDNQRVEIIKLHNTFVTDRAYTRRDENIVIPGIASIVEKLLNQNFSKEVQRARKDAASPDLLDTLVESKSSIVSGASQEKLEVSQSRFPVAGKINVIAYPETNSLLVKGTAEQVRFIRSLVESLDEEKRHIELALWIIDIQKDNLDQLGVNWQGAVSIGGGIFAGINVGSGLNSFSTLESTNFIASILALTRDNKAKIVSRPVLLTQENTPAMFDNNRTFYTPLIAERAVELQNVTYGTLVHVLPRFTQKDEIELSLNIEDGSEVASSDSAEKNTLPTVGRTTISTVARVPKGKSLLIGGYTRGESGENIGKIPLLGDLPLIGGAFRYRQAQNKNTVRLFLIKPREIVSALDIEAENLDESIEIEELIKKMDKTRDIARVPQENLFNGS